MNAAMRRDFHLIIAFVLSLGIVVMLGRWIDGHRVTRGERAEQELYVNGRTAKRLSLAFNGLAADWYWMRSLQYVGRKIVAFEDAHEGRFGLNDLSTLDLRQVKPGQRQDGDMTVISEGVKAGETIVTRGQLQLAPGQKVAVQEDKQPVAKNGGGPDAPSAQ